MVRTVDPGAATLRAMAARPAGDDLPSAIILGGGANSLSVARSLGRASVEVYAINEGTAYVRYSRYCRWLADAGDTPDSWTCFLLGPESNGLRGSVLFACSDDAIAIIAGHRPELSAKFRLEESNPAAQLAMLDKLRTYQAAQAAGVPTPRFWPAQTREQVVASRDDLVFPLIVKPRFTHLWERRSGRKFVVARDFDEVLCAHEVLGASGIETLLVEWIPGPDDRLCSYYTYLDEPSLPLFHFTKRVIRRFPAGMGNGCYHVTDWNPEVRDLALRLFRWVGLRGLANAEFKRDERDGQLKLIECNARFTASNGLAARSGFDLAAFVYNRLVGLPQPPLATYALEMRLWDPVRDFQAFLELRRQGRLAFRQWIASIMHHQTFPYFDWSDPLPALARALRPAGKLLTRRTSAAAGNNVPRNERPVSSRIPV
jgi:predicted ATP-grasp superfamily ATP-dependent carboligase